MKRQGFIWMLVLVFAMTPFLGTDQMAQASDEENNAVSSADMKALVELFEDGGEFESASAAHALKLHLTAVDHFEQQEAATKVVKHMKGFNLLLNHQQENGLISEQAYHTLKAHMDALIVEWNSLTIVRDTKAQADIRISSSASDMEALAATELQDTIQKISDAKLPVVKGGIGQSSESSSGDLVHIILATPEAYPDLSQLFAEDLAFLQQSDGFAVRRSKNRIYIFGSNPRGLLNGVYDFLEENTGILWTRSKEIGTIYEPQSTVKAKKMDYREKSPFDVRGWHTTGTGDEGKGHIDYKTFKMFARNKLNAKYASFGNLSYWEGYEKMGLKSVHLGHNLRQWLPPEEYFESHPEYYNWEDGQFVPTGQLNFYHPDLPHVFADKVKDFHDENGTEYIGIGIHDNQNFTSSPESEEPFTTPDGVVVQPDDPAYKSTVFYTFLNKVAKEVKKTHPDVKIPTLAYYFTEVPPKVELEDNIVIMFAPLGEDERLSFNTSNQESKNYEYKLMLEDWAEKTKNIIYRGYYGCCYADDYERPIAEKVQADAQYFRDLGILGFLPEGVVDANRSAWGVNALQFWLINQLYWDPDADLDALKHEFIQKAYGAAAGPMKQYYDLIKQGWHYDQQPVTPLYTNTSQLISQYIIKAGIKDEAQDALDEAWALADEQERARIEPIRTTFIEMTELYGDPSNLSANATKTNATQEEILQSLNFNTGPWADAEPVTMFYKHRTEEIASVDTHVYLLWDDENLYVGYEALDDDISNMTISDVVNGYWDGDSGDHAETHVSTGDGGTTYAYFTNPNADGFVYKSGPTKLPDEQISQSAEILDDRWNVIQVIPFSDFGFDPQEASELKALFLRSYHGNVNFTWGGGAVWSPADQSTVHLID